jgi:hypothetical protein
LPNPPLHRLLKSPLVLLGVLVFLVSQACAADSPRARGFKTFLPKPGAPSEEPQGQLIQLLLDRKEKDGRDSYLIQVLFRGKPAQERVHRVFPDRVEIDFFDTGKPSMRPARVRGGVLEATYLEELHYRDGDAVRRMVRLTLYTHARPEIRFRNTLDRTLLLFELPSITPEGTPKSTAPADSGKAGNRSSR